MKSFINTTSKVAAAIGLYELTMRWIETRQLETGYEYWRNYHNPQLLQQADRIRRTDTIVSTGVPLHIDIYPQPNPDAPVLIFNHGAGSYARALLNVQMAFYDQGYTVVAGDRRGQGLSGGKRGFTTLSQEIQNVIDIARWSQQTFRQPQFMTGCSMGGPLTYYAAAAGAPVNAVSCFNLYDFTPGAYDIPELFGPGAVLIDRLWPLLQTIGWLSLPWHLLNQKAWKSGIDDREPQIQAIWEKDPLLIRLVPLTFIHALTATAPAVPFEQNELPVQVINPNRDRMSDPAITQRNYERLGGPKHYAEVPYGHYAFAEGFGRSIAEAADPWFKQHGLEKARGK